MLTNLAPQSDDRGDFALHAPIADAIARFTVPSVAAPHVPSLASVSTVQSCRQSSSSAYAGVVTASTTKAAKAAPEARRFNLAVMTCSCVWFRTRKSDSSLAAALIIA